MTDDIRVLLVDDQSMLRLGFRMVLSAEEGIEVVGEAGDGAAGLAMTKALQPDVVLMDVRMPGVDGIEATRRIIAEAPGARVRITRRMLELFAERLPDAGAAPAADARLAPLTPREHEIFAALGEGLSNAEIAERFVLSEATVKTHVARVLGKLGLRDRVQAVVLAYETGVAGR